MLYRTSKEMSVDVVNEFLVRHFEDRKKLEEKYKMYVGDYPILHEKKKGIGKPDNRLVNNYARYIVDRILGFMNGIPIQKGTTELSQPSVELINRFDKTNDSVSKEYEIIKGICIYGVFYELVYQNELAETKTSPQSPLNTFVVYNRSIEPEPVFGVRYYMEDGDIHGEVYTNDKIYDIAESDGNEVIALTERGANIFHRVPLIEYRFSPEGIGAFEPVMTLINNYNAVLSQKANDVEYFSDAYLLILGATISQEQFDNMKDTRILNGVKGSSDGINDSKPEIKFLQKQESDETQEHLLDRLENNIRMFSMVNEVTDKDLSGSTSGIAVRHKLQPMEDLAYSVERMLIPSLRLRYRLLFSLGVNLPDKYKEEWKGLEFKFIRNLPKNLQDEADLMNKLDGLVSKQTMLSQSSIVSDVTKEIDQIKKEEQNIY